MLAPPQKKHGTHFWTVDPNMTWAGSQKIGLPTVPHSLPFLIIQPRNLEVNDFELDPYKLCISQSFHTLKYTSNIIPAGLVLHNKLVVVETCLILLKKACCGTWGQHLCRETVVNMHKKRPLSFIVAIHISPGHQVFKDPTRMIFHWALDVPREAPLPAAGLQVATESVQILLEKVATNPPHGIRSSTPACTWLDLAQRTKGVLPSASGTSVLPSCRMNKKSRKSLASLWHSILVWSKMLLFYIVLMYLQIVTNTQFVQSIF